MPNLYASHFAIRQPQAAQLLRGSPLTYVQQARFMHGIFSQLPEEYRWRYDSSESLGEPVSGEEDEWLDAVYEACMNDLRAACLGLAWKARECAAAAVSSLNDRRLAASASAARASFESATAGIDHVVRKAKAIRRYRDDRDFAALVETLERGTMRGLWGRKGNMEVGIKANHFPSHQESVLKAARPTHPEIAENSLSGV